MFRAFRVAGRHLLTLHGQLAENQKPPATHDGSGTVRLRFLGTDSEQGTCPTVYATDRGTFAVQGKLISDSETLAGCVALGADEAVVEIPKDLVRFFLT